MSGPTRDSKPSGPDGHGGLTGRLRTVVSRLAFQLRAPAAREGITPSRLAILAALGRGGPQRVGYLARQLGLAAASMSRLADALQEAGLVLRSTDVDDHRALLLSLTPRGTDVLTQLRREGTTALSTQIGALTTPQLAALSAALPVLESLADGFLKDPPVDAEDSGPPSGAMTRLAPITVDELDDAQRVLFEQITQGPRAKGRQHFALISADGGLVGPFNAMLLAPPLGSALQALGTAVRYESTLTPRTREIAILTVAAQWDCGFERRSHESVGRNVGLSDDEIAQLRAGEVPTLADPHEQACAHLAKALVSGDVADEAWALHAEFVGAATVFELSTLIGYYATLALQLRAFRVA